MLFEAGAGRGVSITLDDDTLNFNVDGDGSLLTLSSDIASGWHQAVGAIDLVGSSDELANDSMILYVDNSLIGTLSNVLIDDWAGGNTAAIGGDAAGTAGDNGIDYHGLVAVARYYSNYVFDADDVNTNYAAVQIDGGGSVVVEPTTLAVAGNLTLEQFHGTRTRSARRSGFRSRGSRGNRDAWRNASRLQIGWSDHRLG